MRYFRRLDSVVRRAVVKPAAGLLCVTALVSFLAGCKEIEVPGLVPAAEVPDAIAVRTIPTDQDFVEPTDFIELRSARGTAIQVLITDPYPADACGPLPISWPNESWTMTRPRIPIWLLAQVGALKLSTDADAVQLCRNGRRIVDIDAKPPFSKIVALFGTSVATTLVKDPPRRAMPGDELSITAVWQAGNSGDTGETGPRPFAFAQGRARVDAHGFVAVPALSAPVDIDRDIPAVQRLSASASAGSARIQVWQPGVRYTDQPVLQRLAECFAQTNVTPSSPRDECYVAWVDGTAFAPNALNDQRVRYQLDPIQYWTAILDNGERVDSHFEPNQRIVAAVKTLTLRHSGRPLLRAGDDVRCKAFVTVIPREDLGGDLATPFWFKLQADRGSAFDDVALLPGDVVFVTRSKPRSP